MIYEYSGNGLVIEACPTLETPWTVACQAPVSLGFSRGSSHPGIKPRSCKCIGNYREQMQPVLLLPAPVVVI